MKLEQKQYTIEADDGKITATLERYRDGIQLCLQTSKAVIILYPEEVEQLKQVLSQIEEF